jgi:ABC-type transport system involved in multi-copper enzyme maturation permease subunit
LTLVVLNSVFKEDFADPYARPVQIEPPPPPTDTSQGEIVQRARASLPNHLRLIAWHYARHNIRGGTGLMYTLVLLTTGLLIAAVPIMILEELKRAQERERKLDNPEFRKLQREFNKRLVEKFAEDVGRPVARWATDNDNELADYLVMEKPAMISAILMILMVALPIIVCLGSFNQFSGDIQHKGLRYLLLRTERTNIYLGRFVGTVLFTAALLALLFLVLFLYLAFKADFYDRGKMGVWLLQGYGALLLFSLPYIAMCSWISALIDSPFGALAISELITIFIPIFVLLGVMMLKESGLGDGFKYVGYLQPWPLKYQLFHPNPLHVLGASAAILGYTVLFGWLGLRTFQTRDL